MFSNSVKVSLDSIKNDTLVYKNKVKSTYDKIASATEYTYENVIKPLIDLSSDIQIIELLVIIQKNINTSEEIRKASSEAEKEIQKFFIEQDQRKDVYESFNKTYEILIKNDNLEENLKRYLEKKNNFYKRKGLHLNNDELIKLQKDCIELEIQFQTNVNNVNTNFIMSEEELTGLPEHWYISRKVENGYKVTLAYPDLLPILNFCTNRETRKKMFLAHNNKCYEPENTDSNIYIAFKLIELRSKLASLLGYDNIADYVTEIKMSKNSKNVNNLYNQLKLLFDSSKCTYEIQEYARKYLNDSTFILYPYDMFFFIKLREKELCNIDHKIIQEYFPYKTVVNGVLECYQRVLSLIFIEDKLDEFRYCDEIIIYNVFDSRDKHYMGKFILDLKPREGKFSHAASFPLLFASGTEGHLNLVLCNMGDYLSFNEVVTFFHEFGHCMHHICSKKMDIIDLNYTNVETDFIEAPSQMLENWCYNEDVLQIISCHKDTGNKLPYEYIKQLRYSEQIHFPYTESRQLLIGNYDFTLHSGIELKQPLDLIKHWNQLTTEFSKLPLVENAFPASFIHIFGNSYYAGYYSYIWSKIISIDMFETMFSKNVFDKEIGMKYRTTILEPAATKDADEMINNFLGREFNIKAYLDRYLNMS